MSKLIVLLKKDFTAELRSKDIVLTMLLFVLLVIVAFSFAFEPGSIEVGVLAPGMLWISFVFAGVLGLLRSFVNELQNDCLLGLMLCPVDRGVVYLGKALGNIIFMLAVEALTLPVFALLLNFDIWPFLPAIAVIFSLCTVGYAAVGTLFSAMAITMRSRELMLPLLQFPISVPLIIAAVKATGGILAGQSLAEVSGWLKLVGAFDVIFLTVSFLVFEYAIAE